MRINGIREKAKAPLIIMKIKANRFNPADIESMMTAPLIPFSWCNVFGTAINNKIKEASPKNDAINTKISRKGKTQIQEPVGITPKSTINAANMNAKPANTLERIDLVLSSPLSTLRVASVRVLSNTIIKSIKLQKANINTI